MLKKNRWQRLQVMKSEALLIAAIVLLFISAAPVWAGEEGPVSVEVETGWEGRGISGRFFPVVMHLTNNSDKDIAGEAEVAVFTRYTPPEDPRDPGVYRPSAYIPSVAYTQKATLPAGEKDKYIFWINIERLPGNYMEVIFRSGGRQIVQTRVNTPGELKYADSPMTGAVGVVGTVPTVLEGARLVTPDQVVRYIEAVNLDPELFPANGRELDSFGTLLITGEGAGDLGGGHGEVLAQWVRNGGHLVIGGPEAGRALGALPEEFIPVSLEDARPRSDWNLAAEWLGIDNPASTVAATVTLDGAGSPWGPPEEPLGLRFEKGEGLVTVLVFDPGREPWHTGEAGVGLWQKLLVLAKPDQHYFGFGRYDENAGLQNVFESSGGLPAEVYPGWRPAALLLAAYVFLAGPGVYWLLRRLDRTQYAAPAVLALALLLSSGIYLYVYRFGSNVMSAAVHIVEGVGQGGVDGYTSMAFFTPNRPDFILHLDDPDSRVRVNFIGELSGIFSGKPVEPLYRVYREDESSGIKFSKHSQMNLKVISYHNESLAGMVENLEVGVEVRGSNLKLDIVNHTGLKLDHLTILQGTGYKMLGDLEPGETAEAVMEITSPQFGSGWNWWAQHQMAWQFFVYPQGPPAGGPAVLVPAARWLAAGERIRLDLLQRWMVQTGGNNEPGAWPLTILAWSDDPPGEQVLKESGLIGKHLTMFIINPQIKPARGKFELPVGLFNPVLTERHVQGMTRSGGLMSIKDGFVTYAFKPRLLQDSKINEIQLYFDCAPRNGYTATGGSPPTVPVPEGMLEVYNPRRDTWTTLSGSGPFNLPGDFAAENGEVKVKVNGSENRDGRAEIFFAPPRVSYRGERL